MAVQQHRRRARAFRRAPSPWVVLVASLLFCAVATGFVWSAERSARRARFNEAVRATETLVHGRLEAYLSALRGATGLFIPGSPVTARDFKRFVQRVDFASHHPGIQGLGFAQRVPPGGPRKLEAQMQAQGQPDFRIWPSGVGQEAYSIIYLEPLDGRNKAALGYDMYSEPTRREAMAEARDTGNERLSRKLTLVQELEPPGQAGLLLYLPVYQDGSLPPTVEARRQAVEGFIYTAFRADDLFEGLLGHPLAPGLRLQVYDGPASKENLLHDSGQGPLGRGLSSQSTLALAGRSWTLHFQSLQSSGGATAWVAPGIGLVGLCFSLLVFAIARTQAEARAEAERRAFEVLQSEERFRSLVQASAQVVWNTGPRGQMSHPSPSWTQLTGQSAAEQLGFGWLSALVSAGDVERVSERFGGLPPSPFEFELAMRQPKEGRCQVVLRGVPLFAPDGSVREWIGTLQDITARKRAEARLQLLSEASRALAGDIERPDELLARLSWVLARSLASFCAVDVVGQGAHLFLKTVAYSSRRAEGDRCDVSARLPPGTALSEFLPGAGPLLVAQLGPQEPPPPAVVRAVQLGARSVLLVPLFARGKAMGLLTLGLCAEDGRFDREDLAAAEEVGFRTAAFLDNASLFEQAQKSIRVRDEFLSIASHELRTPLTPLQLKLGQLQQAAAKEPSGAVPSARVLKEMEVALRQTRNLAALVEDLLDVSRISEGRLSLQLSRVDLGALAAEVVTGLGPQAAKLGARLELEVAESLVGQWDRLRLEQVLSNLLSNALKYGGGKPVQVRLSREGERACLSIQDEGIGIAAEHKERIFERFERAVSERHYGGLGLGLYITRQIVAALGGEVSVESTPGVGSTFEVRLPMGHPVH